jgi:two-component system chemotaxis response regulator CheY
MRILLVDIDPGRRAALKRDIESLGYESVVAVDEALAWEEFSRVPTDVVLADGTSVAEGIGGLDFCRRARSAPQTHHPYFIVACAPEQRTSYLAGLQAGVDDYLVRPFDVNELRVRLVLASRATLLHKKLAEQKGDLERLHRRLVDEARRDPLTGVWNRLRLQEDLQGLIARVERYQHSYCIALCDIDFFKKFNDTYGHQDGDEVLQAVARTLAAYCRSGDGVYRYGGEEFLLILPEQALDSAVAAMDRILREVERLRIPHAYNPPFDVVTISAGVAELIPAEGIDLDLVLSRADAALYKAKGAGRNRVATLASTIER